MKAIVGRWNEEEDDREVYVEGETFVLEGQGAAPALVTLDLPFAYDPKTFSAASVQAVSTLVAHKVEPYYVIPARFFRATKLEDFLTAEIYPNHFRLRNSEKPPFSSDQIREFIRKRSFWFSRPPKARKRGPPYAEVLAASQDRMNRLFALMQMNDEVRAPALQEAFSKEETPLVANVRSMPDPQLEQKIMELRSTDAQSVVARELVRRALAAEDPAAMFPLLAGAVGQGWNNRGPLAQLHNAVRAVLMAPREDGSPERQLVMKQNLKGATLDLGNVTVEPYMDPLEVLFSWRATEMTIRVRGTRRDKGRLVLLHEGRKVFFDVNRSIVRRVAVAGGKMQFKGNLLITKPDDAGGAFQEMERFHTLAFTSPTEVAARILEVEPKMKQAKTLAEHASTDPAKARQLADLAMEVVFGIDPEVAAALLRARQRYSPS